MKETILIIDDEKNIRLSLAGILEDEGFATVGAASGEAGLEAVRKEPPELVFLDITASFENRKTLVELVEAIAKNIFMPFTVGGGIRDIADIRDLLNAGADKVSINTAAVKSPDLIKESADKIRPLSPRFCSRFYKPDNQVLQYSDSPSLYPKCNDFVPCC